MKKCKYAKGCQNEVIWYMQFVGEEKPSFYFPGYHIRGFKVIPVCDQHMEEEVNRQHDTAQSSEAIEHTLAADSGDVPQKTLMCGWCSNHRKGELNDGVFCSCGGNSWLICSAGCLDPEHPTAANA